VHFGWILPVILVVAIWAFTAPFPFVFDDEHDILRNPFPRSAEVHDALAWILATSSDPAVFDGPRALEVAKQAVRLSPNGVPTPSIEVTLAAALAACGRHGDALTIVSDLIATAQREGRLDEARALAVQAATYRAGRRWTTTPSIAR
jgi:hypothetical protein